VSEQEAKGGPQRADEEETQILRRALGEDAARRSAAARRGSAAIEVYDVDGALREIVPVPPQGLSIGRGADQDIRLPDRTVSRRHCRIDVADDRYWLDDAGSLNDTLLNGEPVRGRAELHDRAQLTVGLHNLVVTIR
jgi:pSer/pThr/pTyr-binding forkhead associated (FHA) protein